MHEAHHVDNDGRDRDHDQQRGHVVEPSEYEGDPEYCDQRQAQRNDRVVYNSQILLIEHVENAESEKNFSHLYMLTKVIAVTNHSLSVVLQYL